MIRPGRGILEPQRTSIVVKHEAAHRHKDRRSDSIGVSALRSVGIGAGWFYDRVTRDPDYQDADARESERLLGGSSAVVAFPAKSAAEHRWILNRCEDAMAAQRGNAKPGTMRLQATRRSNFDLE